MASPRGLTAADDVIGLMQMMAAKNPDNEIVHKLILKGRDGTIDLKE
jgi:hypothetical protein